MLNVLIQLHYSHDVVPRAISGGDSWGVEELAASWRGVVVLCMESGVVGVIDELSRVVGVSGGWVVVDGGCSGRKGDSWVLFLN